MTETLMLKRWVGLAAFFAIPLLAACRNGATLTPGPTAAPTQMPRAEATPTATRAPEPTPMPGPTRTVTSADVEAVFADVDGTWRELFDLTELGARFGLIAVHLQALLEAPTPTGRLQG